MRTAAIITMAALAWSSEASAICLTRDQARELWPARHLWAYGDHCWSNRRGEPPTGIQIDPVPDEPKKDDKPKGAMKSSDLDQSAPGVDAQIFFPSIGRGNLLESIPSQGWPQAWLQPASITGWPLLIDIDRVPFLTWDRRVGQ